MIRVWYNIDPRLMIGVGVATIRSGVLMIVAEGTTEYVAIGNQFRNLLSGITTNTFRGKLVLAV